MLLNELRDRVRFEQRVERREGGAVASIDWVPVEGFEDVPAKLTPLSARDQMLLGSKKTVVAGRAVVRYTPLLNATMRMVDLADGHVYDLAGPYEDHKTRREWMTFNTTWNLNEG